MLVADDAFLSYHWYWLCNFNYRRSVELVEVATKRQKILASVTNSPTKEGACRTPVIQKVTLSHVAKVVAEVYSSSLSSRSGGKDSLPLQQKILICTLILLLKNEKSKQIDLPKVGCTFIWNWICLHNFKVDLSW